MENQLTYESIDARLVDILRETDDLFQSGQLSFPDATNQLYTALMPNKSNVYQDGGVNALNASKGGILSEKDVDNGVCIIDGLPNEEHPLVLQQRHQANQINFSQVEHDKQWNKFKVLEQGGEVPKCPDAGWTEWQKQVFYNFADRLKLEYVQLQKQLCTNFKVDLERNINFLRTQYASTLCALQNDLIYLKTENQKLSSKEGEYQAKVIKQKSELCHANNEIDRLRNELHDRNEKVVMLTRQLGDYEYNSSEMKYSKSSMEDLILERSRKVEALEKELSSTIGILELEHRKNEALKADLAKANAVFTATHDELTCTREEVDRLHSEVERLLGVIKDLRENEVELNEKLDRCNSSNSLLVTKFDNLALEKEALYDRIEEVTASYEKHISTCNRRINQLENE